MPRLSVNVPWLLAMPGMLYCTAPGPRALLVEFESRLCAHYLPLQLASTALQAALSPLALSRLARVLRCPPLDPSRWGARRPALYCVLHRTTAQLKSSFPDRTTHPIAPLVNSTHTLTRDATFSIATLVGATLFIKACFIIVAISMELAPFCADY